MSTERRYDIDWLRVIAIGLLLIYHIAIIFQPWAMFIAFIRSNELLENLWKPMTMLNVWRIPLLFFVSGMGMFFALRKRNWKQLLTERTRRILVPFLFGIVAITPLHMFVFQKYYNMPLTYFADMGHLWFLGNIFVYVLILLPLFIYLKKNTKFQGVLSKWMNHFAGPLSVSIFFMLEAILVKPTIFVMYAKTAHGFYLGLLAFLFGYLFLYSGKSFWQTVAKWKWLYLGIATVLFVVRFTYFNTSSPGYLMALESNTWILSLFGFAYSYLNKPSKTLSYLSKSAYPVYIIHMIVLYLGAQIILPLEIPAWTQFIAITAFTFLGCFLIYELLIRRVGILRPLFGLNFKTVHPTKVSEKKLSVKTVKSN